MRVKFVLDPSVAVRRENDRGGTSRYYVGENTCIHMQNGHPVLSTEERWWEPPADLRDKVLRVEVDPIVSIGGLCRRSGLYRLGHAEGTVEYNGPPAYKESTMIHVSAPTKEEALALWDKILEGSIAPEIDYKGHQVPIPTINADQLAVFEAQAATMAMLILKRAMSRLEKKVTEVQ